MCTIHACVHVYIFHIVLRKSEAQVPSMRPSQVCKRPQTPKSCRHGPTQHLIRHITANHTPQNIGAPTLSGSIPDCILICVHDHVCVVNHVHKQIHIRIAYLRYVVGIYIYTHMFTHIKWFACLAPSTCHFNLQSDGQYNTQIGKDEIDD